MSFTSSDLSDEEVKSLLQHDAPPGSVEQKETSSTTDTVKPLQETPGMLSPDELTDEEKLLLNLETNTQQDIPFKDKPVKKEATTKSTEIDIDYNGIYNFLVDSDKWFPVQDEEGKPLKDINLTADSFAELTKRQAEWKVEEVLRERESNFGHQYKEVTEFLEAGGNLSDLTPQFAKQRDIESLDPTDLEDAYTIIESRYQAAGLSDKKIKSIIDSLKDSGDDQSVIESAKEDKEDLIKAILEEKQELIERQKEVQKARKDADEKHIKHLREEIYKDSSIPERERKEIDKFYFDFKNPLEGGGKATDFYVKYKEIVGTPGKLYKYIKMIKDFDNFENKNVTTTEVNKKIFNIIRNPSSSGSSQEPNINKNTIKKSNTFEFFKQQ